MLVIDLIPTFKVMRNFRELHIWNEGMALAVDAYKIVQLLPKEEEYGLKSQIKRASVSIVSNIAEGCSRASQKEFKHFLEISLGSCFEVETDTLLAEKLGILPMGLIDNFIVSLHTLQKQINALITKLKSS